MNRIEPPLYLTSSNSNTSVRSSTIRVHLLLPCLLLWGTSSRRGRAPPPGALQSTRLTPPNDEEKTIKKTRNKDKTKTRKQQASEKKKRNKKTNKRETKNQKNKKQRNKKWKVWETVRESSFTLLLIAPYVALLLIVWYKQNLLYELCQQLQQPHIWGSVCGGWRLCDNQRSWLADWLNDWLAWVDPSQPKEGNVIKAPEELLRLEAGRQVHR